jgi:hypothetical protein
MEITQAFPRGEFQRSRIYKPSQKIDDIIGGGTTWAAKGQTPVVRTTGARYRYNMISAVAPKGDLRFMLTKKTVTAPVFVEFLKRLMQGMKRRVFLIVDGHPVHRSVKVQQYVASTKGRLQLFFLPPDSPELNPDEQV